MKQGTAIVFIGLGILIGLIGAFKGNGDTAPDREKIVSHINLNTGMILIGIGAILLYIGE